MKFEKQRRREDEPEPVERDDVRVGAHRCPFCHDDVAAARSVACQGCLTRHHEPCWEEAGERCSSCGATNVLRSDEQALRPFVREFRENFSKWDVAVAGVVGGLLGQFVAESAGAGPVAFVLFVLLSVLGVAALIGFLRFSFMVRRAERG